MSIYLIAWGGVAIFIGSFIKLIKQKKGTEKYLV